MTDHGADGDAGVERAVEAGVANGTGVGAAADRLEVVDDFHRAHLGRARDGARGEARREDVRRGPVLDVARDRRHDVHHVAEALHLGVAVHPHRAWPAHAADVVSAEVDQHQVLGALLGVGEQLGLEARVVGLGRAAAARPGNGQHERSALGPVAVREGPRVDAGQHFGAGADEREVALGLVQPVDVEVEQVRARVDLPQRAVQVEAVALERHREALREHHLEDVSLDDVRLCRPHAGLEGLLRDARRRLVGQQPDGRAGLDGPVHDLVLEVRDAVDGVLVRRLEVGVVAHERRRDEHELVAHVVERGHGVVEAPHAVWQSEQVRRPDRQRLDLPNRVVACEADGAGRQARQAGHARLLDARQHAPERREEAPPLHLDLVRGAVAVHSSSGAVHQHAVAAALEHEVRVLAEERVPPEALPALDRLEEEAERPRLAHREERRDGRREVRRAPHEHRHGEAPPVGGALRTGDLGELVEGHGRRGLRFNVGAP